MPFPTLDPEFQPPLESGMEDSGEGTGAQADTDGESEATYQLTAEDREWTQIARDAFTSSDTWFSASMRSVVERSLANFRSVHPAGSKYWTEQYLKKSRIFRPKTRSAIRRGEAGHAIAFFSTEDVVHCSPRNESNPRQVLAAEVHNALVNERLTDSRNGWFKTLIGGSQDAMAVGTVISKECWEFVEQRREVETTYVSNDPDLPSRTIQTQERHTEHKVLIDRPRCYLLPLENVRIDPAADWVDPINTTPYLIELQPTYFFKIRERVEKGEYRSIPNGVVLASLRQDWDSIRKMREGERVDKYQNDITLTDYQVVWVRHNIVHKDGQDWVYDTLEGDLMLSSEVKPIEDVYPHSHTFNRPYSMGCAIIEAHKLYTSSVGSLIDDLQEQTNDIANLRIDNIRHALNPRWIVRRGSGIDVRGLVRNVHSGITYASNVANDIKEMRASDVTRGSFEEQDRINLDIDDIVGTFSGGSVGANRKVGETVGGMQMLQNDSSRLEEYLIRTTTETWVESVMRHFVEMEAVYESDEEILVTIADGLDVSMDEVLAAITAPVRVRCNVGFSATNPQKRIEKLSMGMATINAYSPQTVAELDRGEFVKEVMGALGYRDGKRFFPSLRQKGQDPRVQQLEQENQQLKAQIESGAAEQQGKLQIEQMRSSTTLQVKQWDREIKLLTLKMEAAHRQLQSQIDQLDVQIRISDSDTKRKELYLAREALSHEIQDSDRQYLLEIGKLHQEERNSRREAITARSQPPKGKDGAKPAAANGQPPASLPTPPAAPSALPPPPPGSAAGDDMAGVIARDRFGAVPGMADGAAPP
jgi:hypothetical protein